MASLQAALPLLELGLLASFHRDARQKHVTVWRDVLPLVPRVGSTLKRRQDLQIHFNVAIGALKL